MVNNIGLILIAISLVYSISVNFLFFSKKHVNNYETKIFSILIVVNLIGLILETLCILSLNVIGSQNYLTIIINKIFLCCIATFMSLWAIYASYVTLVENNENDKKEKYELSKKIFFTSYIISILLIIILPIKFHNTGTTTYSYGASPNIVYILSTLCAVICSILIMIKWKDSKRRKIIPLLAYIIGGIVLMFIQKINPALTLSTTMQTMFIFLMYHTIENPDIKMIEQLNSAKEQAIKANSAKTEFLSSMSHEIRTPLNAIVGFSDEIINADSLDEAKENAKDVVNASNTLLDLVNSILDISKIEAGKLEIINSPYDARKTFEELAKLITPKMKEKGLEFNYNIAPDLPETLYGDHANIKKIITNLLSNACKYTSKGFVNYDVSCYNVNGICKLIISVEDSGRGIKKENVDKLFTKFQRLDEDRNTTIEGTGLGLAITKNLVELMGGKIIVHTVYGEGSKFTVTIEQRIEEVKLVETEQMPNATIDLSNTRILLVDDNELNIKVATKLLQRYKATNITSFDNGFDCIEDIKNGSKYDVILLDDMMPKLSGVETLHKLQELSNFDIPVVVLTANAITGMKEKYLKEGFTDYIAKPIEKDNLVNVLSLVIKTQELEKTEVLEIFEYEEVVKDLEFSNRDFLIQNGVDIDKALETLDTIEMYNSVLNDFVEEITDKWSRILEYKANEDMKNYAIEVHSLKSDCKYLGFTTLAELSYQHELKSKENDIDFVKDNFSTLEKEYEKIIKIVKEYQQKNSR